MINKLTLNGISIEYPSHMMVAINGMTIRLLPNEVNLIAFSGESSAPEEEIVPQPKEPREAREAKERDPQVRETVKPFPKSGGLRRVMPNEVAIQKPLQVQELPPNWKRTVVETLRAAGGSAYARLLSSRVFKGQDKVTYSGATKLRRELRAMVDRGELLALGTGSDRPSAQMLYGLPVSESEQAGGRTTTRMNASAP
jgi:hypothetical protein